MIGEVSRNGNSFCPTPSRWEGLYDEDVKITFYSNPNIFSKRTERDDTMEPGELYREMEIDD